jgi:probable HAF family extracellular repeat protein
MTRPLTRPYLALAIAALSAACAGGPFHLAALAGVAPATRPANSGRRIAVTSLETLGGGTSRALAINASGAIVGASTTSSGELHAFRWTVADGLVDLGTLGGARSVAADVNDVGQVVGESETASGETHAFRWTAEGGMRDLGTLGGAASRALAINNLGEVVGIATTATGEEHAFLWTAIAGMHDLSASSASDSSGASDISDAGQIVGTTERGARVAADGDAARAALWTTSLTPAAPRAQVEDLLIDVADLGASGVITRDQRDALAAPLGAARGKIERRRRPAAGADLWGFTHEVRALVGAGVLSTRQGSTRTARATVAVDQLDSSLDDS